jgi:hypothetical protein
MSRELMSDTITAETPRPAEGVGRPPEPPRTPTPGKFDTLNTAYKLLQREIIADQADPERALRNRTAIEDKKRRQGELINQAKREGAIDPGEQVRIDQLVQYKIEKSRNASLFNADLEQQIQDLSREQGLLQGIYENQLKGSMGESSRSVETNRSRRFTGFERIGGGARPRGEIDTRANEIKTRVDVLVKAINDPDKADDKYKNSVELANLNFERQELISEAIDANYIDGRALQRLVADYKLNPADPDKRRELLDAFNVGGVQEAYMKVLMQEAELKSQEELKNQEENYYQLRWGEFTYPATWPDVAKRGEVYKGFLDLDGFPMEVEYALRETPYGRLEQVPVPRSAKDKWRYVNKALEMIEETSVEGGGGGAEAALHRMEDMVKVLSSPDYEDMAGMLPENKGIGEKLHEEVLGRKQLHIAVLKFGLADSAKAAGNIVKEFRAVHLNAILGESRLGRNDAERQYRDQSKIGKALVFYDQHAEEYLRETNPEHAENFGYEVMLHLALGDTRDPNSLRHVLPAAVLGRIHNMQEFANEIAGLNPETREKAIRAIEAQKWARTMGERIWILTGRMAKADPDLNADNFNGGNYFWRRLFNFHEWVWQNQEKQHIRPELLFPATVGPDGRRIYDKERFVDFNQGDFFSKKLIEQLMNHYKYEYTRRLGDTNRAEAEAAREVRNIIGKEINPKTNKAIDPATGEDRDVLDISTINFEAIDFRLIADNPWLDWGIYHIDGPDDMRGAVVPGSKGGGLLREVTEETLFAVRNESTYLSGKQWQDVKERMLYNFGHFMRHDNWREMRRSNWSISKLKLFIEEAAGNKFIDPKDIHHVEEEMFKSENPVSVFMDRLIPKTIKHFFQGALEGSLDSGFKNLFGELRKVFKESGI